MTKANIVILIIRLRAESTERIHIGGRTDSANRRLGKGAGVGVKSRLTRFDMRGAIGGKIIALNTFCDKRIGYTSRNTGRVIAPRTVKQNRIAGVTGTRGASANKAAADGGISLPISDKNAIFVKRI